MAKTVISAAAWAAFTAEQQALLTAAGVTVKAEPKPKAKKVVVQDYRNENGAEYVALKVKVGMGLFVKLADVDEVIRLLQEGKQRAEAGERDEKAGKGWADSK